MKEIGDFFRENFEGAENRPPSYIWENISQDALLKSYNRTQWLKKSAWYGATIVPVITVITVAFYIMNRNPEIIPVPQKETVTATEIIQKESSNIFENVTTSHDLSQNVHETDVFLSKPIAHNPVIAPPATHTSPKIITHKKIIQKIEETKIVEKEQPVKISIPSAKSSAERPSIHNITLPKILPIEERKMFVEENKNNAPFIDKEEKIISPLFIPGAFTPNGDGLNDIFLVKTSIEISDYEINIYDRSGQLVYHSKQIEAGWDGTIKRTPAPQGSYIYVITFTNHEKEEEVKQGFLLLIR